MAVCMRLLIREAGNRGCLVFVLPEKLHEQLSYYYQNIKLHKLSTFQKAVTFDPFHPNMKIKLE